MKFPAIWIGGLLAVAVAAALQITDRPLEPTDPRPLGVGRLVPDLDLNDVNGTYSQLSSYRRGPTALLFWSPAPGFGEALGRIPASVDVLVVGSVAADLRSLASAVNRPIVAVLDPDGKVAAQLWNPRQGEAFLIDRQRTLALRAPIPTGIEPFLSGLAALQRGERPEQEAFLSSAELVAAATNSRAMTPVTYHNRISRLAQRACLSCHRAGGVGPFSLESLADWRRRAATISRVVGDGRMPPWFAAGGNGPSPWHDEQSLDQADRADILAWIAAGLPEGEPGEAPVPLPVKGEWEIGKPDAIFQIPAPVEVPADGFMEYHNAYVPTSYAEDRWVQAIEIQPTARQVVHHVLVFTLPEHGRRVEDPFEEVSGFFASYVPGNGSRRFSLGLAKRLPARARLRFQIHYTPNGKAAVDQLRLGIIFAKSPPRQEIRTVGVANLRITIPPGASNHRETAQVEFPFDAELHAFMPHMHVRGKAARFELTSPTGQTTKLLEIPRYDFNWQLAYVRRQPILVRKGSRLEFQAWYDNSLENAANPDPSHEVGWGDQIVEEMHLGYVDYTVPGLAAGQPMPKLRPNYLAGARPDDPLLGYLEALFKRLDRNRDGKLTPAEAGELWEDFREGDTDRDGRITLNEVRALFGG